MTDKRVESVPLDTDEGVEVVRQQNVGRDVERGGGEFPDPHTPPTAPAPGAATGTTTLTAIISEFEADGYRGQFVPAHEGQLTCLACNTKHHAGEIPLTAMRREEGASDPADMIAVAALECPSCGTRGTVVLKYGPGAGADEAEVLRLLQRGHAA